MAVLATASIHGISPRKATECWARGTPTRCWNSGLLPSQKSNCDKETKKYFAISDFFINIAKFLANLKPWHT
jgi:hypothetical protein